MYVDGDFVDRDISPSVRGADEVDTTRNNEFMIGRPNDGSVRGSRNNRNKLVMDQFKFWSMFKTGQDIKEIGTYSEKHQYYNVTTKGPFPVVESDAVFITFSRNPMSYLYCTTVNIKKKSSLISV